MKFAGFILFSSLEYITFVFFILVLFRFNVREYVGKFTVFSIVLAFVSNTLQTESLQAVSPLIQAALMISFVAFFLKVPAFSSIIMVITGYVINFIATFIAVMVVMYFTKTTDIEPYTRNAFIAQAASAFMIFSLGLVTLFQKGGFSFVTNRSRINKYKLLDKKDRPFIIFLLLSIIVIFIANWLYVSSRPYFFLMSLVLFFILLGLLYFSVKRDKQQND